VSVYCQLRDSRTRGRENKKREREKRKAVLYYISQNKTLHNNINHSPVDLRGHDDSGVNKVGCLVDGRNLTENPPKPRISALNSFRIHYICLSQFQQQTFKVGNSRDFMAILPSHVSPYDISIGLGSLRELDP
jgi:hypothetical protein